MANMIKLGMMVLVSGLTVLQPALAQCKYDPVARAKDAKQLMDETKKYCESSKRLHAQMERTIKIAERLKGHATDLQIKVDQSVLAPRLSGAQLKAAKGIFDNDLKAFKAHADQYAAHLKQFRATVGECKANASQYAEEVKRYELHTSVFHMPNIPPPHVCGELNLSQGDASHIANQMASDEARLISAELQLADAQEHLNSKMAAVPALQDQVLNANRRAREEKLLVQEFARLKEEYGTLAIEHAALVGKNTSGTLSSENVSGKLKSAKAR